MKKLLAILLSMLLLCSMIPFATVSAADEPTIVVEVEEEEYNAGDEFEVVVNLENNPGLIAATVEIEYDHNVFEVAATYDEDEEAWLPAIEVGTTYKASSNKYITFGQIDEEAGVMKRCVVSYIRGTATSNCDKEWFFTATFKVKDDAVTGDYTLKVLHKNENFVNLAGEELEFATQDATVHINGTEPACEHEYFYACDKICSKCGELTNPDATHNVIHVPAKDSTCNTMGNIEYWYCDACGAAWLDANCTKNTNPKAVFLPFSEQHTYDDDMDADCNVCGDIRYVEYVVETFHGNSFSETNDGLTGLAFRYDLTDKIQGMAVVNGTKYVADYANATITPDSTGTYKLVKLGALVANEFLTKDVDVEKIVVKVDGSCYYAIRIIDIPEYYLDATISCTPYYVYENAEGEQITVYGEANEACAIDFMD